MSLRDKIIDIVWADRKLGRSCRTDAAGRRRFGAPRWKLLRRRLGEVLAAPTLADLHGVDRFHPLRADRAGQYALSLDGAYRLIFEPGAEPPRLTGGGIDEAAITRIVVIEVADYHG